MLLSSNLATPGIMASIICAVGLPEELHVRSILLGNMIFACGVCTLLQTFIGARYIVLLVPTICTNDICFNLLDLFNFIM